MGVDGLAPPSGRDEAMLPGRDEALPPGRDEPIEGDPELPGREFDAGREIDAGREDAEWLAPPEGPMDGRLPPAGLADGRELALERDGREL